MSQYEILLDKILKLPFNQQQQKNILLHELLQIAYRNTDEFQVSKAYLLLSYTYYNLSDEEEYLKYINRAQQLAKKINDLQVYLDATYSLATYLYYNMELYTAIAMLHEAVEISIKTKYTQQSQKLIISMLNCLSDVSGFTKNEKYQQLYYHVTKKTLYDILVSEDSWDNLFYNNLFINDVVYDNIEQASYIYNHSVISKQVDVSTMDLTDIMLQFCYYEKIGDKEKIAYYEKALLDRRDEIFQDQRMTTIYLYYMNCYMRRNEYSVVELLVNTYWKYKENKAAQLSLDVCLIELELLKIAPDEQKYIDTIKRLHYYSKICREQQSERVMKEFRFHHKYYEESKKSFKLILQKSKWKKLADMDELTGVYNRQGGINAWNAIREKFKDCPLTFIIIIDVDNFKQINESKGHLGGDSVLKALAQTMSKKLVNLYTKKEEDSVSLRYGGDEFVAVGYVADRETLFQQVEDMQQTLKDKQISVSIGGTYCETQSFEFEQCLQKADEALYKIKNDTKGSYFLKESTVLEI